MSNASMGKPIFNPTAERKEDFTDGAFGGVEVGKLRTKDG
jgi:hypothetical protein